MARRRTFGTLGGFDEGFRRWSEWDFAVRAALKGAHFIAVNEPLITQHKTHTADKSGRTSLEYALRLTRKHKHYLANEKVYLSSVAWAHARFHAKKGHFWMTRFFRALALVFLPPSVLFSKLASRFARAVNTD